MLHKSKFCFKFNPSVKEDSVLGRSKRTVLGFIVTFAH